MKKQTMLTRQILLENGFEEKMMYGQIFYVKGNCAVVHSFKWVPCNLESGVPLSTNVYVNTMEELEKLLQEGGQK